MQGQTSKAVHEVITVFHPGEAQSPATSRDDRRTGHRFNLEEFMDHKDMKRLYLEHRAVEEARNLDAVVATFDDDCFLENVALGTRASGREAVRKSYQSLFTAFPDLSPKSVGEAYADDLYVTWGTVHGTMDGAWMGIQPTHRSFTCAFFNVVPFRNGKMQGERLFFDIPALCSGAGISIEEVLAQAVAARQA